MTTTTVYHYHFHWLPTPQYLLAHPLKCPSPNCEEGQLIYNTPNGEARRGDCLECNGTGLDPAPECGECGCGLEPGFGPIGALIEASTSHYHKWRYLLCGVCAWAEAVRDDNPKSRTLLTGAALVGL